MTYVDMLVHLDAGNESATRLDLAARLARQHGARLIGLWTADLPTPGAGFGGRGGPELSAALRDAMAAGEAAFTARLGADGIDGEWRSAVGNVEETVALHGRYVDLLIVGQRNPDTALPGSPHVAAHAVLATGRPVLVVPYAGKFDTLGEYVTVAWNGTPYAARAVADAMPILMKAQKVTVLTVNSDVELVGGGIVPASDLALHLTRHGVKAEAAQTVTTEVSTADLLLNRSFDSGNDLLVAGAYGHSRMRELILGGTTRALLDHMTLPVLMSH